MARLPRFASWLAVAAALLSAATLAASQAAQAPACMTRFTCAGAVDDVMNCVRSFKRQAAQEDRVPDMLDMLDTAGAAA